MPDDPLILEQLGEAHFKDHQKDLAREAWTRSLKLNPSNEKVKILLQERR